MATNNNEAAASDGVAIATTNAPGPYDPLASYREHYAEVAHSAIVRDAWDATVDAIQKIAVPIPPSPAVRCFVDRGPATAYWAMSGERAGLFFSADGKVSTGCYALDQIAELFDEITYAQLEAELASWPEAQQALRAMAGERPKSAFLTGLSTVPTPPAKGAESLKELTILRDYIGLAEGERAVAFERGRLIVDGPGGRRESRVLLNSVDLDALRTSGMPDDAEPGEWLSSSLACWHKPTPDMLFTDGDQYLVAVQVRDSRKSDKLYWEYGVVTAHCDSETPVSFRTHDGDSWGWDWSDVEWFIPLSEFRLGTPKAASMQALTRELEGVKAERGSWYASWRKLTEAIVAPRPRCRDCADSDGTCSTDGLPCDPTDLAIEVHRRLQQQLAAEKERAERAEQLADDAILVAQIAEHDGVNFHEPIGDIVGSIEIRKGTSDNANWLSLPCEYREDEAGWVFPVVTDEIRAALKAGLQETAPGDFSEFEERQAEYQSEYQSALTTANARIAELEREREGLAEQIRGLRCTDGIDLSKPPPGPPSPPRPKHRRDFA